MSEELSLSDYRSPSWWHKLAQVGPEQVRERARKTYHKSGVPICTPLAGALIVDFGPLVVTREDKRKIGALLDLLEPSVYGWRKQRYVLVVKPEQLVLGEQLGSMLWPLEKDQKKN